MEIKISCRDLGFECKGVINAKTEREAIRLAGEHAKSLHGVKEITPEIIEKIRSVMKEVPPPISPW